jgi:hypothetical protein
MMDEKMPGKASMACGTLLSIAAAVSSGDLVKCLALGAIGTVVSYAVSRVLKALFE